MFRKSAELKIPDAAKTDPQAAEILRIWLAGGAQHVSLKTAVWDDPAAWGLMLADLARHVANSYTAHGVDYDTTLKRVVQGFQLEMQSPTDEARGTIED
jgi:hypothetical protein